MKILSIAAAVALCTVSLSALAKDADQVGVADNAFTYTAATSGSQSVVIGSAIEGSFSSQTAVALGSVRSITGTGHSITGTGHSITGTGHSITGTGHSITGTGHSITGTGHSITGTGHSITGTGHSITGTGHSITGTGH